MNDWRWLVAVLVVLAIGAALFGLDRLCLWLEDRGWLYYRKKKRPRELGSSAMSAWVGLQQIIEPGIKHVIQMKQEKRSDEDGEAARQRLFDLLSGSLDAAPVRVEEIRLYLTAAQNAGLDWRHLYEEVVQAKRIAEPDRASRFPAADEVAP